VRKGPALFGWVTTCSSGTVWSGKGSRQFTTLTFSAPSLLRNFFKALRTSRFICPALKRGVNDCTSTEDVDVCRWDDTRFSRPTGR